MRIAIVAGYAPSLADFRGPLLAALAAAGHEVIALAPPEGASAPATEAALRQISIRLLRYPFSRRGRNPWTDLSSIRALRRLFRGLAPDLVLSCGVKPAICGSLAGRLAGVPRTATLVTGLGYAFGGIDDAGGTPKPRPRRLLTRLVTQLCRAAFARNSVVIFQNPEDRGLFARLGVTRPGQRTAVVAGSGVDLVKFAPTPLPKTNPAFLCMTRLLWSKGVGVYVEACRMLKRRHPEAVCRLLGPLESGPDGIPAQTLARWRAEGVVEVLDPVADVRPHIAAADVVVLPSFYREGVPRSCLEAMATARPVITTTTPGCRETVEDGVTGYLVPPYEPGAVMRAMERLLDRPERIAPMGAAGRRLAEERFDARRVAADMLAALPLAEVGGDAE